MTDNLLPAGHSKEVSVVGWGGQGRCRADAHDYPQCLIGLHEVMGADKPSYVHYTESADSAWHPLE